MSFGTKMKAVRKSKGISLSELAAASGLSINSLCSYENEKTVPQSFKKAKAVADALDVTVESLMDNPDDVSTFSRKKKEDPQITHLQETNAMYRQVIAQMKMAGGDVTLPKEDVEEIIHALKTIVEKLEINVDLSESEED